MSDRAFKAILNKYDNIQQLDDFLKTSVDKESFVRKYNDLYGPNAYEQRLTGGPRTSPQQSGGQQSRGQQPGGQSSARPGTNQSGSAGRGGPNPNTGAGSASSAGAGPKPSGSSGNASPGAGPRPSGSGGNTTPGGAGARPAGASGSATPGSSPRPLNHGQLNNALRMRIWNDRSINPRLYDLLELEYSQGRFNPKTGDLAESAVERLGRAFEKMGPTVVSEGSGGFSPASFAKSLNSTKAGQKLVSSLYGSQRIFTTVVSKIPPPLFKVLSKIKFVFILLNFARFVQALLNGTLEYKQTIEFIAACASINPAVAATLGSIPIVGPGLVIAIGAVNLGAADVVEFFGNPEAGLNYMGFQITGESMRRKTDKIDFSTVDVSTLDKSVQNALAESVPLIKNGLKIREILVDPGMVQRHPWLSKRDDIRFTQFSGALGMGGFYKQNRAQSAQPQQGQQGQQGQQPQQGQQGAVNQQGQPVYNNAQQSQQQLRNHNDLLYKAYVDTVQTTNITLENLKNYRDQIITKINNLAPMYPNINAQQAITALDNRIRKYSGQAQAQPA
jgi:hypothetical protein